MITGPFHAEEIEPKVKRKRKKFKESPGYRELKVAAHVTIGGKGVVQKLGEK